MNQVNLSTLAGGAVAERFEDALDKVIKNIQDVNTDVMVFNEKSVAHSIYASYHR